MARLPADLEDELESEFEDEVEMESHREDEDEWEDEGEEFLGGLARAVGGLLGEGEDEWEDEDEGEEFLGGLARTVGGLLGEGEDEDEWEDEAEGEAEEFFGRVWKLAKRLPWKKIIKFAAPKVATMFGGPLGGMVARAVTSQLEGESEYEDESEAELEEMASAPLTSSQALAEYLADRAASAESEAEAEAMAGVAAYVAISPRDRAVLRDSLPTLLSTMAIITKLLRGSGRSHVAVRYVPGIASGAARTLARQAGYGTLRPVDVARAVGRSTGTLLRGGPAGQAVLRRHARGVVWTRRRRHHGYGTRGRTYRSGTSTRRYPTGGYPTRAYPRRTYGAAPQLRTAPRRRTVRVETPVRVAGRDGVTRTVRMVTNVPLPRGAVSVGRSAKVVRRGR